MPIRLALVGQGIYFRQCALEAEVDGVTPSFVDFRQDDDAARLRAQLAALDPDIVVMFRPEIVPAGLFDGLRAVTVGFLTEPLPRSTRTAHPDLKQRLEYLRLIDPANFDRIVSFDPLIAGTVQSIVPVWRSLALPVADSFYAGADTPHTARQPRILFIGRSTAHREAFLEPLKRNYDIVHFGHGLGDARLHQYMDTTDVGLNLHNEPYPSFENRVCLAMAAGQLVVSEPLSPAHELEPGRDFVEVRTPAQLEAVAAELASDSDRYAAVRSAGRRSAERFRASSVYPRLVRDALADVAAHGGRG